jgi:rare lipoprotein A
MLQDIAEQAMPPGHVAFTSPWTGCGNMYRSGQTDNQTMRRLIGLLLIALLVPACAPRSAAPRSTPSPRRPIETRQGLASYYADSFHGKTTASGVRFDTKAMVAAHPTYPFGTRVRVTSLASKKSVEVVIVDRGPARGPRARGVIIDLSRAAASRLGFLRAGRTTVRLEVLSWGK